jgi:hypothetical protein
VGSCTDQAISTEATSSMSWSLPNAFPETTRLAHDSDNKLAHPHLGLRSPGRLHFLVGGFVTKFMERPGFLERHFADGHRCGGVAGLFGTCVFPVSDAVFEYVMQVVYNC